MREFLNITVEFILIEEYNDLLCDIFHYIPVISYYI